MQKKTNLNMYNKIADRHFALTGFVKGTTWPITTTFRNYSRLRVVWKISVFAYILLLITVVL